MAKYGEVSWSDDSAGSGGRQENSKDMWLRLDEGTNELRIVTQPYQYSVHKYKKDGDSGFGQKINCCAANETCPLCVLTESYRAKGDAKTADLIKAKSRWLLGVISRKTGTYKILDVSWAIYDQIKGLSKNTARWGNPLNYDIDIFVDKKGGATGYYKVQPISKEPLSATDQKIREEADLELLKMRVTPPDADYVQRRMDKINGVLPTSSDISSPGSKSASTVSKPVVKAPPSVATVQSADEDDLDTDFPDYAANS